MTIRPFIDRRQVALRVGVHWFGVRSPNMPALWSERHRAGWHVRYLRNGWRVFYRRGL